MFADDINLFYSSKNIKTLFKTMKSELIKIFKWLKKNKLFLNIDKTNFVLFHPCRANENLSLKLPLISVDGFEMKQVSSAKFLGVPIDENITWEQQITLTQNKISGNLDVLFKTKNVLDFKTLLKFCYCFIDTYLIYANIAWTSTNKTKLKKLYNKQKDALIIIFNKKN